MKDSLIVGASIILAALIISATAGVLLRYDTYWKGNVLIQVDRFTGTIRTCTGSAPPLICVNTVGQ